MFILYIHLTTKRLEGNASTCSMYYLHANQVQCFAAELRIRSGSGTNALSGVKVKTKQNQMRSMKGKTQILNQNTPHTQTDWYKGKTISIFDTCSAADLWHVMIMFKPTGLSFTEKFESMQLPPNATSFLHVSLNKYRNAKYFLVFFPLGASVPFHEPLVQSCISSLCLP